MASTSPRRPNGATSKPFGWLFNDTSAQSSLDLEQRKVLALLPVADFEVEAVDLGLLQLEIVVDEEVTEARAQRLVVTKGRQRLAERAWQGRRFGLIGRVGGRAGIELAVEAIQAAHDLARHIKVG